MRSITASFTLTTLAVLTALATLAGAVLPQVASAGPPFQTDDPVPVDLHHYEFYVFAGSDSTSGEIDPAGPAFEFNWGALPNTQIHVVLSFGAVLPSDGPSSYGLLDTELGVKYRLIGETKYLPEVGTFPMIEVPTGSYSRGLGVGKTHYKLPIWVQKDFGPWTTYGGGGYQIVPREGFRNFPYAGWLLQRDVGEKLTLGGELWYHGPEGAATPIDHSVTMFDFGGYYYFRKPAFQLLFTLGHTIAGQSETYAYLGLYWTWGPKEPAAAETAGPAWSFAARPSAASARLYE